MNTQTSVNAPCIVSFGSGRSRSYIKVIHSKTSYGKHLISTTEDPAQAKEFDNEELIV